MATPDSICRAQPLLGTFVEIAGEGAAPRDLSEAIDEAFGAVAQVHRLMSFHDPQSDVSRLNREAFGRAVAVHSWTYQVLELALDLHRHSAGLFDISVAPFLQQHGLLPRGTNDADPILDKSAAAAAGGVIELLGDGVVRYRNPQVRIDLGGCAKGFAVDRALEVLRKRGLSRGLVNAGGDMAAFGDRPELIHVRNPKDVRQAICQVEIRNAALASSGRLFDPLHFADMGDSAVVDPSTGRRVSAIAGATVRAPCCALADALTKAVMIAGEGATELLQRYRASALMVLQSGAVSVTTDWQQDVRLAA